MREQSLQARFTLPLSAASGLVLREGVAYLLGDDRTGLDRLRLADGRALPPIALLDQSKGSVLAKADKPDLEALLDTGDGRLLALGSGSRPRRERGFCITRDHAVHAIDLAPLYRRLREEIEDLNIEGAARHDGALVLAHRGVGGADASRLIRLDARALAPACTRWTADLLLGIAPVALGTLDGVALGFTDLACDDRGTLHYLAAAEATTDAYLDGACRGSVIGRLDAEGRAHALARLRPDVKAEGLSWLATERWLLVTDADDPARPSTLYELALPR